jgi:hypothetical protein
MPHFVRLRTSQTRLLGSRARLSVDEELEKGIC